MHCYPVQAGASSSRVRSGARSRRPADAHAAFGRRARPARLACTGTTRALGGRRTTSTWLNLMRTALLHRPQDAAFVRWSAPLANRRRRRCDASLLGRRPRLSADHRGAAVHGLSRALFEPRPCTLYRRGYTRAAPTSRRSAGRTAETHSGALVTPRRSCCWSCCGLSPLAVRRWINDDAFSRSVIITSWPATACGISTRPASRQHVAGVDVAAATPSAVV